jgi:uncharacterized membrane protein YqaE (UPF0057 family)
LQSLLDQRLHTIDNRIATTLPVKARFETKLWLYTLTVQLSQTGKPIIVDVIRILIAIILPPVGVFLQVGLGLQFWLNILLTLCGYVPGIIHAIWVILRR